MLICKRASVCLNTSQHVILNNRILLSYSLKSQFIMHMRVKTMHASGFKLFSVCKRPRIYFDMAFLKRISLLCYFLNVHQYESCQHITEKRKKHEVKF